MSTSELNNPIILHILLSKDTWHQTTQKACENRTMISEKDQKILAMSIQAMLLGSSLLKEHEVSVFTLENKVLPYSPGVGLSLALQIKKIHGFNCDIFFFQIQ